MLNRLYLAIALACAVAFASPAAAQSNPNLTKGQVLTAGQWNALFAGKQDTLGFIPASTAGATFTGRVVTPSSGSSLSGFNITPGGVPLAPANGDLWMTTAGLFVRVNGTTVGPLAGFSTSSFAAVAPIEISFPGGITTYACSTCGVTTSPLSQFANTTSAQLAGIITDETGSGALVFATSPTLVTPTLGVATATSINKVAITAPATSATLTIANGKTLTASNSITIAGVDAKTITVNNSLGLSGTDGTTFTFPGTSDTVVTLTAAQTLTNKTLNSPTFVTPNLGVATAASVAIGGATIGSNGLAVTGTSLFSGATTVASNSASAIAVGLNGATNPAFVVDASTASSATGLQVKSAAAGGSVGLTVISSGANESLAVNAKGTGVIQLGNVSTGAIQLSSTGGTSISNGLTVTGSFTATGLVPYGALQSAAIASSSEYLAGTGSKLVQGGAIYQAETATTYGATTTLDFNTFINTSITLTGNISTLTLTNVKAGKAGQIRFIQDGTGSRTTVWNTILKFTGGVTPALSTAAGAIDVLNYSCISATYCVAALMNDVK